MRIHQVKKSKTTAGDLAVVLRKLVEELESDPSKELDCFKSRIPGVGPKSQSTTVNSVSIKAKVVIRFFNIN